jgi:hypothetical protein
VKQSVEMGLEKNLIITVWMLNVNSNKNELWPELHGEREITGHIMWTSFVCCE